MTITWEYRTEGDDHIHSATLNGHTLDVSWNPTYNSIMWTVTRQNRTVRMGQEQLANHATTEAAVATAQTAAINATPRQRGTVSVGGDIITHSGSGTLIVNTGNGDTHISH